MKNLKHSNRVRLLALCAAILFVYSCKKSQRIESDTKIEPTLPYHYKNSILGAGKRFDGDAVFTTSQLETITDSYGSNRNYLNANTVLDFTFIAPIKAIDTLKKRPFIMLMHGGGFVSGSYTSLEAVARSFAVRGYAAATIEYRLGFNPGAIPCLTGDSLEVLKAVYRATQDANAAMRYFVKNADTYGIDTAQLYVFGSSAGNVISTSMLYNSQTFYDSKIANLQTNLGALTTASNAIVANFNIKAELSVTGYGLFDKTFITPAKARPAFYMQGSIDATLPLNYGPVFNCPLGTYGHTYGSAVAADLLGKLKFPYEHYVDEGADHDISAHYPSTYYIPKMAAFLKRLWKGEYKQLAYKTFTPTKNETLR